MVQSPSARRGQSPRGDEKIVGPTAKEHRYVLFPAGSPTTRSRTASPLSGTPYDGDAADPAPAGLAPKRSRSVRNLLSTPSLFKRKPSMASFRKPQSPDAAPRALTVRERRRDHPPVVGRPPTHERSSSAPGTWRLHKSGEKTDLVAGSPQGNRFLPVKNASEVDLAAMSIKRKPVAPHNLRKLVIPVVEDEPWRTKSPRSREAELLDGSNSPPQPPPKEIREASPRNKGLAILNNLSSASLASSAGTWTPITAPDENLHRKPWQTPTEADHPSHRRLASESSVMSRGRSRKRRDSERSRRRKSSMKDASSEVNERDSLPVGSKTAEVHLRLCQDDLVKLHEQALGQAARFEVLGVKDVDALSKELRALDQKCEYLRKTQMSLRSSRQALHSRTMAYLKSPRMTELSRESMVDQAQALADLDLAIDGWVMKLERAENRRTRIRQKLLEHVAAAATLKTLNSPPTPPPSAPLPPSSDTPPTPTHAASASFASSAPVLASPLVMSPLSTAIRATGLDAGVELQASTPLDRLREGDEGKGNVGLGLNVMTFGMDDEPPRTPDQGATPLHSSPATPISRFDRRDVESIRVYADATVCALFAEVEQEIGRMTMVVDEKQGMSGAANGALNVLF